MKDDTPTRPGLNGGTLRSGGDHPRPGRPPHEYRESLRKILDDPSVEGAITAILANPKHPQFASLWARVAAQAHGNPVQPVTVDAEAMPTFKVECE